MRPRVTANRPIDSERRFIAIDRVGHFKAIADGVEPVHDYPFKVYIAAPLPMREAARTLMLALESRGYEVTSRWLTRVLPPETGSNVDYRALNGWARTNLTDIRRSNVVVAMNFPHWRERGTGGRHFETGYAVAMLIPVILFGGPHGNVFHYLDETYVRVVESTGALYDALDQVARNVVESRHQAAEATATAPTKRSEAVGGPSPNTPSASAPNTITNVCEQCSGRGWFPSRGGAWCQVCQGTGVRTFTETTLKESLLAVCREFSEAIDKPYPVTADLAREALRGAVSKVLEQPHKPTEEEWRDLGRPIDECSGDHCRISDCSIGCAVTGRCVYAPESSTVLKEQPVRSAGVNWRELVEEQRIPGCGCCECRGRYCLVDHPGHSHNQILDHALGALKG